MARTSITSITNIIASTIGPITLISRSFATLVSYCIAVFPPTNILSTAGKANCLTCSLISPILSRVSSEPGSSSKITSNFATFPDLDMKLFVVANADAIPIWDVSNSPDINKDSMAGRPSDVSFSLAESGSIAKDF